MIINHGRDDAVLLGAEDCARLRRYEQKAFHVSELPRNVVDELGRVAIPKAALNEKSPPAKEADQDETAGVRNGEVVAKELLHDAGT
ncbi:MAG: hypothetical protein ACREVV_08820 [Steroidobacteraceae bacterium]